MFLWLLKHFMSQQYEIYIVFILCPENKQAKPTKQKPNTTCGELCKVYRPQKFVFVISGEKHEIQEV